MANLFGNDLTAVSTNNGAILDNIANQAVSAESILTLKPDDSVTAVHISPFGKNLLNTTSLNTLRTSLLSDNEEAIAYNGGDNLQEINFHTYAQGETAGASNLRVQIKGTETIVNNSLLVSNIKDSAGNQSVNITSGQLTLQRPKITFRDSAYTDRGYLQTQNSGDNDGDNTSGYLEFYTGLNARCAFMGLGGSNEISGVSGKTLSLSMEQN